MKRKVRIDDGMGPAFYVDEDDIPRGTTSNGTALIIVTLIGIVLSVLGISAGTGQ